MNSSMGTSAQCRSSKINTSRPSYASASTNRRHAVNSSSRGASDVPTPMSGARRRRIQSRCAGSSTTASTASASFAPASSGSSESRMPACAFTISPNAQKPTPSPYGRQRPCRNRIRSGSSSMNAENSRINRVLPTPGSPITVTSCGEPPRASCSRYCSILRKTWRSVADSSARPTNVVRCCSRGSTPMTLRARSGRQIASGSRLALHGDRGELLVLEHAGGGVVRRLADDDRPGGGDVLQSRRGVHHVARDALADLRPLAERDHGLAGVDPDPDGQLQARLLAVGLFDVIQDLQAGADRALGVVLVPHRARRTRRAPRRR